MKTVAACLILFATAARAEDQYNQRIENLRAQAEAERKKLGLSTEKARASYPTPEVSFSDESKVMKSCPGKSVDVKVTGHFVPKTSVVIESDDVKVSKEQLTKDAWTATLTIAPNAKPQHVMATFASPVSFNTLSNRVLDVDCRYAWTINLDSGQTLQLTTNPGLGVEQQVTGQWAEKGKKPTELKLTATVDNGVRLMRFRSEQEMTEETEAIGAVYQSPEMQKLTSKMEVATAKVQGCTEKPQQQMVDCMNSVQAEMEKLTKEREALTQQHAKGPTSGCEEFSIGIQNGKLDGDAKACVGKGADEVTQVSGTYKAL